MRKIDKVFSQFCVSHCCRDDVEHRKRSNFCPIVDKIKEKYGSDYSVNHYEEVFFNMYEREGKQNESITRNS